MTPVNTDVGAQPLAQQPFQLRVIKGHRTSPARQAARSDPGRRNLQSSTRAPLPGCIETGNLSNAKGVGGGVFEYRIDFGPDYRIDFGRDGGAVVILLGGGTRTRQQRDIEDARSRWREYRLRKRQEARGNAIDTRLQGDNSRAAAT